MQNMHMRTHTNTQMCTRTQPNLQTQNTRTQTLLLQSRSYIHNKLCHDCFIS